MKKSILIAILAAMSFQVNAGEMKNVSFTSEPTGATIRVASKSCVTPCNLSLDSSKFHTLRVDKEDYYQWKKVVTVPSPLDLISGGLIDAANLARGGFYITLRPKKETEEYCSKVICAG